ncbi:MAG TPA: haloacid dehalogenase, partial [Dehalococcoidia bacterium]|nr:haloacid dehalogenase [Dehalococcoidia bacterium]
AAAGMPLGLALNQAEGLRQTTEAVSRRSAWQRYEESVGGNFTLRPGNVVHAEAGERFPFEAVVREGTGITIGNDGMPLALVPGSIVPSGSPLYGGPFSLELRTPDRFTPELRTAPEPDSFIRRYLRFSGLASIGYALARGLITRSPAQAYDALLMVNSRVALVGSEAADAGGAARVTRANGVVVGTRPERGVRLPDALIIDRPALLLRGYEVSGALVLSESHTQGDLLSLAKGVSVAAENPWGNLFPRIDSAEMTEGQFDGGNATARLDGVRYTLGPLDDATTEALKEQLHRRGEYLLVLHSDLEPQPVGLITLHPRLSDDVRELVEVCEQHGVAVILLSEGDSVAAEALANRAGVMLAHRANAVSLIKALQSQRKVVAFVSDHANAGAGFAACDLAIGIANANIEFPARADVLVPDLTGVAAVIDAGSRRNRAVRDSTILSILTNVAGVVGGFFAQSFGRLAINITSVGALAALAVGWLRLKGGERSRSTTPLGDPMPERWGRRSTEDVLSALESRPTGLTSVEAGERYQQPPAPSRRHRLFDAVLEQLRSPIVGIMAGGAVLSLVAGNVVDVLIIAATVAFNVAVGAWQEHQVDRTLEALERMGTPTARVLRDGETVIIKAEEIVPGDVLMLVPGDRVAADSRMVSGRGVE